MSLGNQGLVHKWALATGDYVNDSGTPALPPHEVVMLRKNLIAEEFNEVYEALSAFDLAAVAKELGDLMYVVYGTAVAYGIPLDRVFKEVHRSNMTKVVDGRVIKREDGKILKPASYEPADIESVLTGEEEAS